MKRAALWALRVVLLAMGPAMMSVTWLTDDPMWLVLGWFTTLLCFVLWGLTFPENWRW